jgi:hypothetical protein
MVNRGANGRSNHQAAIVMCPIPTDEVSARSVKLVIHNTTSPTCSAGSPTIPRAGSPNSRPGADVPSRLSAPLPDPAYPPSAYAKSIGSAAEFGILIYGFDGPPTPIGNTGLFKATPEYRPIALSCFDTPRGADPSGADETAIGRQWRARIIPSTALVGMTLRNAVKAVFR